MSRFGSGWPPSASHFAQILRKPPPPRRSRPLLPEFGGSRPQGRHSRTGERRATSETPRSLPSPCSGVARGLLRPCVSSPRRSWHNYDRTLGAQCLQLAHAVSEPAPRLEVRGLDHVRPLYQRRSRRKQSDHHARSRTGASAVLSLLTPVLTGKSRMPAAHWLRGEPVADVRTDPGFPPWIWLSRG